MHQWLHPIERLTHLDAYASCPQGRLEEAKRTAVQRQHDAAALADKGVSNTDHLKEPMGHWGTQAQTWALVRYDWDHGSRDHGTGTVGPWEQGPEARDRDHRDQMGSVTGTRDQVLLMSIFEYMGSK